MVKLPHLFMTDRSVRVVPYGKSALYWSERLSFFVMDAKQIEKPQIISSSFSSRSVAIVSPSPRASTFRSHRQTPSVSTIMPAITIVVAIHYRNHGLCRLW